MVVAIRTASSLDDKKRVYHFRYYISNPDDLRDDVVVDHEAGLIYDKYDQDAQIIFAEKNDRIVGTLRIINNQHSPIPQPMASQYRISPLEKQLGPGSLCVWDMFFADPRMRGETLVSLIIQSAHQQSLNQGNSAVCYLAHPKMVPHYQRLGFRQYHKALNLKNTGPRVPLVLCTRDYNYLLRVLSPLAMGLCHELDDLGSTKSVIADVCEDFQDAQITIHQDIGSYWAYFADQLSRLMNTRPCLFDGRKKTEINTILKHAQKIKIPAGQKITLPENNNNIFGVILKGHLGDGVESSFGHHWFEIYTQGDTFVVLKINQEMISHLVALENCEVAILPSDLLQQLKKADPVLATRLSMNMIAIIQHRMSELEEDTRIDVEEESIYVFL